MNEPQLTDENQQLLAQQAAYRAALDSGLFQAGEAEVQNSRQFYLSYEELIDELQHFWKGEVKDEKNEWAKPRNTEALMGPKAAHVLGMILKGGLSKIVRLTNFRQEDVMRLAYQSRERVAGWLATEGWLKYKISVAYLPLISHQCELLIYSSLLWGLNAGGQRFMTTSGRSIESVSMFNPGQGGRPGPGKVDDSKKWFNVPKIWGK